MSTNGFQKYRRTDNALTVFASKMQIVLNATRRGILTKNPSMRTLAKTLRSRASEHSSNFCEQFEQRPNFPSTFKLDGTIFDTPLNKSGYSDNLSYNESRNENQQSRTNRLETLVFVGKYFLSLIGQHLNQTNFTKFSTGARLNRSTQ